MAVTATALCNLLYLHLYNNRKFATCQAFCVIFATFIVGGGKFDINRSN